MSTAALVISSSWGLALIVKATLALTAALTVARLCVRSRAALRHLVFAVAFGALLVILLVSALVPVTIVELPVPRSASSIVGPTMAARLPHAHGGATTMPGAETSSALSLGQVLVGVWLTSRRPTVTLPAQ